MQRQLLKTERKKNMKKNLRKILSLTLVLIIALSLSLTAFGASITAEDAKAIALKDAGYSEAEVVFIKVELDYDDGVKEYEVEFDVYGTDVVYEYEYDIRVSDGKILSKDVDVERIKVPGTNPGTSTEPTKDIGKQAALEAAYKAFGFTASEVKLIEVEKDYEDGVLVYEIEFAKGYDCEYSCDVIAATGAVVDMETDLSRSIFDKIELFFKVLFAQLFAR